MFPFPSSPTADATHKLVRTRHCAFHTYSDHTLLTALDHRQDLHAASHIAAFP